MAKTALDEMAKDGKFVRSASGHRNWIEEGGDFPPESGRYHLHVALACPWACGTLSMLFLKGLDHAISYSVVHPTWGKTKPDDPADEHHGWIYRIPGSDPVPNSLGHGHNDVDDACIPDPLGAKTIREVYERSGDMVGKFTTPVLVDKTTGTIVNNESLEILRILNSQFQAFAEHPEVDLFPSDLDNETKALNEFIYPTINDGVYRCGFARSQEAYDEAMDALFASLDRVESILAQKRYLTGDRFTWIDLRLFHTLVRFDPVYVTYFKTNLRRIVDYTHLPNFVRDVYQKESVKQSISLKHIKMHYFTSHPVLNTFGIVPRGGMMDLEAPHGRERIGK